MHHPFRAPEKRFDPGKWLMLALLFILSFTLFYQMTLRPSSDISIHATWAAEGDFSDPVSFVRHGAHPMWHVLVSILLHLGLSLPVSSALITALSKVFIAWVTHRLMTIALHRHLGRTSITLMTAVCMCVSCLCVPFYNPKVYIGIGTPNTWHSCTQLMAMAFMLVCVPYTAWCYDCFTARRLREGQETRLPWMQAIILGVLVWEGPKSIFVIGAKVLTCIAYGCKDTPTVRKLSLITNSGWFVYNVIIFSVTGFICDGFMLLSVITGIIRHDLVPAIQKKRAQKDLVSKEQK